MFSGLMNKQRSETPQPRSTVHAVTACIALLLCAEIANAQNARQGEMPSGMELIDTDPFDVVYFTQDSGGEAVRTELFEFPNREVPQGQKGMLRMRLPGIDDEYQALWKDIERLDLWE